MTPAVETNPRGFLLLGVGRDAVRLGARLGEALVRNHWDDVAYTSIIVLHRRWWIFGEFIPSEICPRRQVCDETRRRKKALCL